MIYKNKISTICLSNNVAVAVLLQSGYVYNCSISQAFARNVTIEQVITYDNIDRCAFEGGKIVVIIESTLLVSLFIDRLADLVISQRSAFAMTTGCISAWLLHPV